MSGGPPPAGSGSGPAARDLRAWLLAAALWPAAVCAFHWSFARPGMALAGWDLRNFFFAVREATAAALRDGHLPGWQRGLFLGYPLLADPQAAALAPATWLTLPWDAPRALALATLLHLVLCGLGMLWFLRLRGLGPAAGLLGALLFALGAKQTVHLQHWNFAASTAWWPWMLAGLEGFRRTGRGRHLLLTALSAAASWLGGAAQMAYLGTLVAGAYALALAPELWRRRRADALLALAAAPLGLLLAGPAILPAAELARLGPRGEGVGYAFATSWKWPDRYGLSLFLLPRAFGGSWQIPEMNLWEATGYVGILPLGLAAAAPLRRREGWLWLALAAVGVWLCFGEDAWLGLHRAFYRFLPGFGAFRNPTRTLFVTSLCAAILSAEALHALRQPGGARRAVRAAAVLTLSVALAHLLPRLPGFPLDRAAAAEGAAVAGILALGGVGWLALRRRLLGRPRLAFVWAPLALLLCARDLYGAFGGWNEVAPAAWEVPPLAEVPPLLDAAPSPRRVAVVAEWGQTANAALRRGFEGATGYGPTVVRRVHDLLEATRTGRLPPGGPLAEDANFPRPSPASPLWPLLAAPVVVSDRDPELPALAELRAEYPWQGRLAAYAAPALPRVYWTGAWEVRGRAGLEEHLRRAARGEVAILEEELPGAAASATGTPTASGLAPATAIAIATVTPTPTSTAASASAGAPTHVPATGVRILPDALEATVEAPAAGLAVVLDPWFPGWTATVDGAAAPVVRANHAFLAVPVPAGRHALRLEYRNAQVGRGALLAGAALLALLAALAWRRATAAAAPAA